MRRLPALCLSIAALPLHAEMPRYAAEFDAQNQQLKVKVCLDEAHDRVRFVADSEWAMRFVSDAHRGGDRHLDESSEGWSASGWGAGECLSYRADLGAIAAQHKQDIGWKLGK